MAQRTAVIDLGTNTFNLLISQRRGKRNDIIFQEKYPVKLGQSGINRRIITEEAYERGLRQIQKIHKAIRLHKAAHTEALATSAIRHASNGEEFIRDVFSRTGISIKIISGSKEAEYIYYGVRSGLRLNNSNSLIMDIGGGSTEFIIGNKNGIIWKKSFKLGAARLLELFKTSDPMTKEDIAAIERYLRAQLRPLFRAIKENEVTELIGSSGSFDTFADVLFHYKHGVPFPSNKTSFRFPGNLLNHILFEMINKNRKQRLATPGMLKMRVDMISIAALITKFIMHELNIKKCRLSTYSLKEGVLETMTSKQKP